ncbi:hypothetical protein, partial [Photobacterium sp. DNB22_13_2]
LQTYAGFQDRCFQPLSHLSVSAAYINSLEVNCKPPSHLTGYLFNTPYQITTFYTHVAWVYRSLFWLEYQQNSLLS